MFSVRKARLLLLLFFKDAHHQLTEFLFSSQKKILVTLVQWASATECQTWNRGLEPRAKFNFFHVCKAKLDQNDFWVFGEG